MNGPPPVIAHRGSFWLRYSHVHGYRGYLSWIFATLEKDRSPLFPIISGAILHGFPTASWWLEIQVLNAFVYLVFSSSLQLQILFFWSCKLFLLFWNLHQVATICTLFQYSNTQLTIGCNNMYFTLIHNKKVFLCPVCWMEYVFPRAPKLEDMCAVRDKLVTSGLRDQEIEYAEIQAVNLLSAQFYVSGNTKTLRDNRPTRR